VAKRRIAGWQRVAHGQLQLAIDMFKHHLDLAAFRQAGNAVDARALAPQVLPGALSRATADAIARAESGRTALALLLVSPEFLRR
jgi:uncharacterized protein (DUF1800 family)